MKKSKTLFVVFWRILEFFSDLTQVTPYLLLTLCNRKIVEFWAEYG